MSESYLEVLEEFGLKESAELLLCVDGRAIVSVIVGERLVEREFPSPAALHRILEGVYYESMAEAIAL